jgi:hypothetical protein
VETPVMTQITVATEVKRMEEDQWHKNNDYELLSAYKWEVEKDSWGSDHYPINITLEEQIPGSSIVQRLVSAPRSLIGIV